MLCTPNSIFSLYRSYLRQVNSLPHVHLRLFFRIKGSDDFRSLLKTESIQLRRKKLKRVSKVLQRLRDANSGKPTAFDRILDIAYGRVGKLRWELMEPLLSNTNAPPLAQIDGKFRSPVYSPELVALLTSGISRTTRPLQIHQLFSPPGLRDHANALVLGLPSTRREHNIQWRFFKNEWKKVYPPLQASFQCPENHTGTQTFSKPPLTFGFQNVITLRELLALGESPPIPLGPSDEEKGRRVLKVPDPNPCGGRLSVRWLRRRYQSLLGKVPLLIPRPSSSKDDSKRSYDVQLANNAITASRLLPTRLRFVDTEDLPWISDIKPIDHSGRRE